MIDVENMFHDGVVIGKAHYFYVCVCVCVCVRNQFRAYNLVEFYLLTTENEKRMVSEATMILGAERKLHG